MSHYGDTEMSFLDAILTIQTRLTQDDLDRYFATDIALAIKTIINNLDSELTKARNRGYTQGYIDAEKQKDKVIDKIIANSVDKGKYTGYSDINGNPIYTGSKVKESCNGLIGTVGWDHEKATYKLLEYGDYYIEDADVEWEVLDSPDINKNSNETEEELDL